MELEYTLRQRATSSPTALKWILVDDISYTEIGEEIDFSSASSSKANKYTLDLSSLGPLTEGTSVTLRLVGWGATSYAGTLNFLTSITLTGTAEQTGTVEPVPLSVSVADFGEIYAGVESGVALTYAGDNAKLSITADQLIAGTTNYVGGVFHFLPDAADIGKTFTFTATVSDSTGVEQPVSGTFTATVVEKPWIEDFEAAGHNSYYTEATEIVETAATWRGTNFQVYATTNDGHNGNRAAVFRATEGYIEMTTGKENGAGSISFWHGIRANAAASATASIAVKVSNNNGTTWTAYTSDSVTSSKTFSKTTLDNVNVGGTVRVRFEVECSHFVSIDDIAITDYEGEAEIDPAIGEIQDFPCYAGESCAPVSVAFFGDQVVGTTTNISATAGVDQSEYSLADGVFNFTPSDADLSINGGAIEFTITLNVPGKEPVSRSFTVTVRPAPLRFLSLGAGVSPAEDFDGIGEGAAAELPAPWRVAHSDSAKPNYNLSYADAASSTTRRATNADGSISQFGNTGIYNLGTNEADRAIGFVSGGDAYQTCALMVPVKNVSPGPISKLQVSYNVEKWRKGVGKRLALCISDDGESWTEVQGFETVTKTDYSGESATDTAPYDLGYAMTIDSKKGTIRLSQKLSAGETIYLGWFYVRAGTSGDGANGQCLGVDDINIRIGGDHTILRLH